MTTRQLFQPTIRIQPSYTTILLIIASYLTSTVTGFELNSNFDHKECRVRAPINWKGDAGDSSVADKDYTVNHPRNLLKVHSRKKRFISFPPGSSFTFKNELVIVKDSGDRHTMNVLIGVPITLNLPEGPISIMKTLGKNAEEEDEDMDQKYNYIRIKRSDVSHQRKTAFDFIESTLNSFGLPGKSCLLKAVCESAEESIDTYGMLGDMLHMFLSASFGGESEEMKEFIKAEEVGRMNATCDNLYNDCPFHLTDFLQSGLSIMQSGLIDANTLWIQ